MLEGLYAAAAGMEAQQNELDAVSSNIANEDTPGYEAEQLGFGDLLYGNDNDDPSTAIVGAGARTALLGYSQTQGTIEQTGNPLDVAIQGTGYIEVSLGDGRLGMTRNGTLQLNGEGQLETSTGQLTQPPITVPRGTQPDDVTIAADGTVSVKGTTVGKLTLLSVPNPAGLIAQGNSVFSASAASGALQKATQTTVQQGALTESNVDETTELTNMESTEQAYTMGSKAFEIEQQLGQIAASIK